MPKFLSVLSSKFIIDRCMISSEFGILSLKRWKILFDAWIESCWLMMISSNFSKLSIFQPNKYKFKKVCPLSSKDAPAVDYKNIKLLKRYVSENGKILPSRITSISQKKQRELSTSIKRARNLALI